jgi:hypothetical protein
MTVYSSEHDQVTSGVEASSSSRLTDSGHERRSSLGESSKRRSRSRERDKTQEPSFLPDVIGTEGICELIIQLYPPSKIDVISFKFMILYRKGWNGVYKI